MGRIVFCIEANAQHIYFNPNPPKVGLKDLRENAALFFNCLAEFNVVNPSTIGKYSDKTIDTWHSNGSKTWYTIDCVCTSDDAGAKIDDAGKIEQFHAL